MIVHAKNLLIFDENLTPAPLQNLERGGLIFDQARQRDG